MGNTLKKVFGSDDNNTYVVGTLNYSGILNSPFEFYNVQHQEIQSSLSLIFQELLKLSQVSNYSRTSFKWEIGKIDQKLQKLRYTPIYMENCGIIQNQIINQQNNFKENWEKHFTNGVKIVSFQYKQSQRVKCLQFDLLCYKTILFYIYQLRNKQINSQNVLNCSLDNIDKNNIQPYLEFMKKFYAQSFLNEEKKIQKTIAAIQNQQIDIMFLQEASQALINRLEAGQTYKVIKKDKIDSIIIIRKNKFDIQDEKKKINALSDELKKELNWNNDTVVAFIQNAVLFSGHLSSKKDRNPQQLQQMKTAIEKIKTIFPHKHVIVGCDANAQINFSFNELNVFPKMATQITTVKKRTMLQPQVSKAQQLVKQRKDYLISNLNLINAKVTTIQNKDFNQVNYLPCQTHPYDHFMVTASLKIEKIL